jgi:hypothetical protein
MSAIRAVAKLAAVAALGSTTIAGCAAAAPYEGTIYNFDWNVSGSSQIAPFQVFDDGQREFIQFTDPTRVPAILADTPAGPVVLTWDWQPPYVVIEHPESALIFRVGRRIATAVRGTRNGPPEAAEVGLAAPVKVTGLAPDPLTSEGLASRRQRLDRIGMAAAGLAQPSSPMRRTSSASRFIESGDYRLARDDGTIAEAFSKWGEQTGWQIKWDTPIEARITGPSLFHGSLDSAVTRVVLGLRQAGYPIWVTPADPVSRTFRVFETQSNETFSEIQR